MSVRLHLFIFSVLVGSTAVLPGQALKVSYQKPAPVMMSLPAKVVRDSLSFLGVPYVHAGDSRTGMDCSGLVYRVFFETMGVRLPRGVEGLYRTSAPAPSPLHIGDLLFFDTTDRIRPSMPAHVGVYVGQGRMVHAASDGPKTGVIVSSMTDPYYRDRFIGARRVVPWREPLPDNDGVGFRRESLGLAAYALTGGQDAEAGARAADTLEIFETDLVGDEQPRMFFIHFWANDDAIKLARGIRTALETTAITKTQ